MLTNYVSTSPADVTPIIIILLSLLCLFSVGRPSNISEDPSKVVRFKFMERIAKLNAEVERKTAAAVAEAKASGKELDPAFSTVLKPMRSGGLWAGSPVYVRRSPVATYTIFAIAAGFCLRSGYYVGVQLGPIPLLVGTALMFLWYDLYTGFLHVVLDEPENIKAPYIGQPALEFQWHHQIPTDIVRKDFSDVVGDLNVVVVILTFIHFFWSTSMGTDHIAGFLAGMKLLWAWYGQVKLGP